MRLFVALYPPESARRDLSRHLRRRHPRAKLTPVEKWHVTLAFLGEVAEERLPALRARLAGVAVPKGRELRLRGGGDFARRVTWAGVEGELDDLAAAVRDAVELTDERPFRPHLTVAYARDDALTSALADYAGPGWAVEEITLVHSDRGVYRSLGSW
ncbi:RNA 2',3'-cyclic phosphodiesterase [Actinoplanes sp. RD1]|uniref:RNA 2',3'-cyclic phosphodiesterase n=1 Tax=Actinoplanes sp. RD1 TaxID=3064538 RepID=UPI002740F749|nr:RNA 2',3'-cyclic phosphodiesterase [Actinoplanes sp. RD1]